MKYVLSLFIVISLFMCSCHKQGKGKNEPVQDICNGSYIVDIGKNMYYRLIYCLDSSNGNTIGPFVSNLPRNSGNGTYNIINNSYYVLGSIGESVYLIRHDFGAKETKYIQYSGWLESYDGFFVPFTSVLCNAAAGKVYYTSNSVLFELQINNDRCIDREIFRADCRLDSTSLTIDENTGFIYYICGASLMKADPASGVVSTVRTYTDVRLNNLQFNKNDGSIYAIDTLSTPCNYVRIAPADGSISVLARLDYVTGNKNLHHTFDECGNRYMISGNGTVAIEDLFIHNASNGALIKRMKGLAAYNLIYIKHPQMPRY